MKVHYSCNTAIDQDVNVLDMYAISVAKLMKLNAIVVSVANPPKGSSLIVKWTSKGKVDRYLEILEGDMQVKCFNAIGVDIPVGDQMFTVTAVGSLIPGAGLKIEMSGEEPHEDDYVPQ